MRVLKGAITNGAVHRPSGVRAGGPASRRLPGVRLRGPVGAQRERVARHPAQRRVLLHRLQLGAHRVDRPAAEPAPEERDEPDVAQPARAVGRGPGGEQHRAEVGGDRVVPGRRARSARRSPGRRRRRGRSPRGRRAPPRSGRRSACRPRRRPRPPAGRTARRGRRWWPARGSDAASAASDAGSPESASSTGHSRADAGSPARTSRSRARERPARAMRVPGRCGLGQVGGEQPPHEAGGAEDDEVMGACARCHAAILTCPSRSGSSPPGGPPT